MSGKRRLPLEKVLLGFLMQDAMHGYDLHQRVESELGEIWYVGISNVYSVLKQLEQAGQVESDLIPQEGRPSRKVYRVVPAGERSFLTWLRKPVAAIRDIRILFLAKLYFFRALGLEGRALGLEGVEELIAAQEAVCRERIERLEQREARCSGRGLNWLVFEFRRCQVEAILDWLQVCREEWV